MEEFWMQVYPAVGAVAFVFWCIGAGLIYSDGDMNTHNARVFLLVLLGIFTWPFAVPLGIAWLVAWVIWLVFREAIPPNRGWGCHTCANRGASERYYMFYGYTTRGAKRKCQRHELESHGINKKDKVK